VSIRNYLRVWTLGGSVQTLESTLTPPFSFFESFKTVLGKLFAEGFTECMDIIREICEYIYIYTYRYIYAKVSLYTLSRYLVSSMDFNVNVRTLEKCRCLVTLWTLASVHLAGEPVYGHLLYWKIHNFACGQSHDGQPCDIYVIVERHSTTLFCCPNGANLSLEALMLSMMFFWFKTALWSHWYPSPHWQSEGRKYLWIYQNIMCA
jgi:hypothetical protein